MPAAVTDSLLRPVDKSNQGPTAVAQRLLSSPWIADFLDPSQSARAFTDHSGTAEQLAGLEKCPASFADVQPHNHGQLHCGAAPEMHEPDGVTNRQAISPSPEQQLRQPCQTEQAEAVAGAHELEAPQVMPDPAAACVQHQQGPSQPDESNVIQPSNDDSSSGGAAAMQPFGHRAGRAQRDWTVHGEIKCTSLVKTATAGSPASPGPASSNQSGVAGTACDVDVLIPAGQYDASAQVPSDNACENEDGHDLSIRSEASGTAA